MRMLTRRGSGEIGPSLVGTHVGHDGSAADQGEKPTASPVRSRSERWWPVAEGVRKHQGIILRVCMLLAAAAIYILRSPTSVTAAGLWAEDGTALFKDAIEGGWTAPFDPYAGQLIVLQRVVTATIAPLPAAVQPTLYAVASVAVAVLSCALILSTRWRDQVPLGVRFACLLALLSTPGIGETYVTLVNSHWWLGIGLLLLGMLRDPMSRVVRIGEIGFAALVATSGFAAIYGIPVLAVRLLRTRSRHSLTVLCVAIVGLGVQMIYLLGSGRSGNLMEIIANPVTGLHVFAKRILATAAIGESGLSVLWPYGEPSVWAISVALVLTTALALMWIRGARMEIGALLLTLIGGWLLALWALTAPDANLEMLLWPGSASRFFMVPIAVLYISLVVSWPASRRWMTVTALASAFLLVGIIADYRMEPRPRYAWAPFADCIDHGRGVVCSTTIAPAWALEVEARGR